MTLNFAKSAVAALFVIGAAAAQAATPIVLSPIDATTFAGSFGGNQAINTFTLDLTGLGPITQLNSFVTANFSGAGYDVTGVTFDGNLFTPVIDFSVPGFGVDVWQYLVPTVTNTVHTIVVTGKAIGGSTVGFTGSIAVTAVPEPTTYALLLGGLGVVGFVARRRKAD
ncbi:FxDxF family PEP-CTERM protein [Paucibacter sp. B2R-40]|uniref:FxDxF family PEP-CTERM protein n=1 Tax=Paucibacter sp. B2R-40 TaxID=2893554 RepID=UPI0021E4E2E3|nr:FxDxF family PEP-CTERM protein [Paucibacter sp. B2R-40]MCV2357072.1 FxDxF family PEP-CTERM protein [Paucibacter sp. B2R-40]